VLLILHVKIRHNAPANAEASSEEKMVGLDELGWQKKEPVRTRVPHQLLSHWAVCWRASASTKLLFKNLGTAVSIEIAEIRGV